MQNPKMIGSNLIDCVPQGMDRCPNSCSNCFFHQPNGFYRDIPFWPTEQEAEGKIVRVNSVHDSNIFRGLVIRSTDCYTHRFFNTSIPLFDFPAPVMFTCNGGGEDYTAIYVSEVDNLMAVRVRVDTWNLSVLRSVVYWYTLYYKVPVLLTFMRYKNLADIPITYQIHYEQRKHVVNEWWDIKKRYQKEIMDIFAYNDLVFTCGTLDSNLCKDCGNCEELYWRWMVAKKKGKLAVMEAFWESTRELTDEDWVILTENMRRQGHPIERGSDHA